MVRWHDSGEGRKGGKGGSTLSVRRYTALLRDFTGGGTRRDVVYLFLRSVLWEIAFRDIVLPFFMCPTPIITPMITRSGLLIPQHLI